MQEKDQIDEPDAAWTLLVEVCGLVLGSGTMNRTMQRLGDVATTLVPGCDGLGIVAIEGEKLTSVTSTSGIHHELDVLQLEMGEGPLHSALEAMVPVAVDDTATDDRWPAFSAFAAERSVRSVMALPMILEQRPVGVVDLYSSNPLAFATGPRQVDAIFAAQAAVVLANSQTIESSRRTAQNLEQALRSRPTIDQAKGVLMARQGITADEAFQQLAAWSNDRNRKLRDVAQELLDDL